MGDAGLFAVGIGAIAILLVLILWVRLPPFLALLTVATGVALLGGVPVANIGSAIEGGMGKTLGHVAIIIALGAMIGRMIDYSGGAEAFAARLVARLGEKRVPAIVVLAAFVLGVPVFFEVGVVMLMPIAYRLAHVTRRSLPVLAIPMCTTLLTVHAMLPPHPGAVAVAGALGVSLGRMLLFGLPIAALTALVIYTTAGLFARHDFVLSLEIHAKITDRPILAGARGAATPPSAALVASLVGLPIVLIMAGTLAGSLAAPNSPLHATLSFIGTPYIALLIDVFLCTYELGVRRGAARGAMSAALAGAIPDTAMIILTTGAGGAFAQMLVDSGIGAALSQVLRSTGLPILALGFVITMALRAAQGPTTVALLTTAGIMTPLLKHVAFNANQLALVALAMGAGGMAVSHVNDAGFWIVTRMSGLSVRQGLMSWTPATTLAGLSAFLFIAAMWRFV